MSKSTYSLKVLELVAKAIGDSLAGYKIIQILKSLKVPDEYINYPNTKWRTIYEVFEHIKSKDSDADNTISKVITEFIYPLNHNADEDVAHKLSKEIEKYLKYDKFYITGPSNELFVVDEQEMDEMHTFSPAELIQQKERVENRQRLDEQKIKDNIDTVKKLKDNHQTYMDIIEIFCQNTKKPTKELNDAYLFLVKKIESAINQLGLQQSKVNFYKPFKNDLYTAEIEWNGTEDFGNVMFGPKLSWDAVRPYLHRVHSEITRIYNISEENTQITDDDKRLEEITNLITEKRTQQAPVKKDEVKKMEILHRYEKADNKFYITQDGYDFKYKGKTLNISKNNDYFKVFCALYALIPEGGEVKYKELITEIKSRMPEVKSKTETEMRKFIQANLTDKSNGFMRYAEIPKTEDNGKPLIKVIRGFGVCFNNRGD